MRNHPDRRTALAYGAAAVVGSVLPALADEDPIKFALTPVLLTSDLDLLDHLQGYLERTTGRTIQLITRRTYQEITALLISAQVDGAWLCGFPFVQHKTRLKLLAVPVWRGRPLYQSYLITAKDREADEIDDLAGDIHAFSDPDSNSGYLVTASYLAARKTTPDRFFGRTIFTYGHFNVVRAVAAGLAQSGSVDGYVYEVLRETNPDLVAATRVAKASNWFGFPPIACPIATAQSPSVAALEAALLGMHLDINGRQVLTRLRLDQFAEEPPQLFDPIEANWNLVRAVE